MTTSILQYYDIFDEWARLETPAGIVELDRTLRIIDRYVPAACNMLDLGGGPGRYTLAMAERGHRCQLVDLSPRLVEEANARISDSLYATTTPRAVVGDATDLSAFADASFDCVLALGPFYHVTKNKDRKTAARECFRVLRRGGVVLAAFIPRLSGVADLIDRAARSPEQVNVSAFTDAATDGIFENASAEGFQSGCYLTPLEAGDLFRASGFQVDKTISVRSILYGREKAYLEIAQNEPDLAKVVQTHADELSSEEAVVATCGQALVVARKPAL
ncbi:class I SAM-dependent methyltransferase [Sulfitobacter sp. D35]|uniref:class I SAM-dependent methyltransferase n=1 Tax=Sulfitobacter sp. D35 TaxID=3083252 RepID=UPI00296FF083|nr:class I SAM-dependent methyltransferase [Sulfitobacter sp. D35]MDW4500264.1 class I SAM-dependent methyltransferase [Sulfitobacter sp. D35]